jgi:EAL domain-containing protein (putative c-di-GMP-specific phosphodiesterase class I)
MPCAVCTIGRNCAESTLHLVSETADMTDLLAGTLTSLGIAFESRDGVLSVSSEGDRPRIIGLLRHMLSVAERQAVSVCELRGNKVPIMRDLDDWWRFHETDWFERALVGNLFETWFQPIVNTATREILGHECLIRLETSRLYSVAEIVQAAQARNQVHAFDSQARRLAILSGARQNRSGRYFVNFMPSSIYNPEFCMRTTMDALKETGMSCENFVFEVVESDFVRDAAHLRRICDYYRSRGFGFALDDVGTGSSSLQMLCDLRPDYAKLDKSLVQNVEKPMYGATIRKLVELADQFSVKLIAEGVENIHTMENLWLLGVQVMQGYLFGRPARNVINGAPGLMSLARALDPVELNDGTATSVSPFSTSCRPGSAAQQRRQGSTTPSLVVR